MWKNIFIESCILSALIFGGFYVHSKIIKEEINISDQSIKESLARQRLAHISGRGYLESNLKYEHLSGKKARLPLGHVSGKTQKLITNEP